MKPQISNIKPLLRKFVDNKFSILIGVLTIGFAFFPYLQKNLVVGDDWMFHIARIETIASALESGIFPVKFHPDLSYGFGYGVGFFYPNLFLYLPALMVNGGVPVSIAYKIFAALLLLGNFVGMYVAVRCLTKNKYSALLSSVMYVLSISVMENFYKVFAVGRSLAMIFIPLVLVGMFLWCTGNKGCLLLGIGFSGIIYSHVLSVVLSVIACGLIAVVYVKNWITNRDKILKMMFTILSVCAITASFWLPMLEQWKAQRYRAAVPWTWVDENVVSPMAIISPGGVGWLVSGLVLLLGIYVLISKTDKTMKCFYFIGVGFLVLPCIPIFWKVCRELFKFLQFPARLFCIATVFVILTFALWTDKVVTQERAKKCILTLIIVCNIISAYSYMVRVGNIGVTEDLSGRVLHHEIAGLGAGEEWLPLQTTREYLVNPEQAIDDLGNSFVGVKEHGKYSVDYQASEATYLNVPFVWYKGFSAVGYNGKPLEISQNPETGLVRVSGFENGVTNHITVWYEGTRYQKLSYLISCVSVIVLIYCSLKYIKKKKVVIK